MERFVYMCMKDAICCINQKVNLFGVIVEYGIPEKSRGSDWFCSLKIVDASYQGHGLMVSVFAESMDKLPHVKSAGDIIRLSKVQMKIHHGKVNIFFNKKASAFALFGGKYDKSFNPYQVSSSYCPGQSDKNCISSLRSWLLNFQLDSGVSETVLPLRQIKQGTRFDLVCKVLKVHEVSKDAWILYLWDGTDAPPLSCQAKLNEEMKNPLPLQWETSFLPRDVLCEFPSVGTILRVPVDQANEKIARGLPCRWVKFLDLVCTERAGLWHGGLGLSTRVRILSDNDRVVTQRQRNYEERLIKKWDRMPYSAFPWPSHITETDHEHVPFATLMNVLTSSQVTAKFKCVVRVVAILPYRPEEFRSPIGTRVYRLQLTLEDPTARIHAFIYDEDGEKFFGGSPSMEVLTRKRNKLMGVDVVDGMGGDLGGRRNPPWVQVCLKSYYIDENDKWGSRKYRVFDTTLVA
ncbi:hypothetical protein ACHQM5_030489 [Ranunculus cassubicifolius]